MKKLTNNKQLYKDTFDQIHLSEEAYRQIRNMEETIMDNTFVKKKKLKAGFVAVVSMAALAVVLLSANGIVYAATGNNLMEEATQRVYIYIKGETETETPASYYENEDGSKSFEISSDNEEEDFFGSISYSGDSDSISGSAVINGESTYDGVAITDLKTAVKQKKGKTYLVLGENDINIEITKDFADGEASDTFIINDETYRYTVTGTVKEYSVTLEKEEQ